MPPRIEPADTARSPARSAAARPRIDDAPILLVLVPGAGMTAAQFETEGVLAAIRARGGPVTTAIVDPGFDAYLDGAIEHRLLAAIADARRASGARRVWLAGISVGCQAILRCVRCRPGLAEGLILLTPYLASTGLVARVTREGGLRDWAPSASDAPDHALLAWLASTGRDNLPRTLLGYAREDRFAANAALLAPLLPPAQVASVAGRHDWESWRALWRLVLAGDPFGWP